MRQLGRDNPADPFHTLMILGAAGTRTDGQLLERFLLRGDDADHAFAEIVRRHGPMVLRVGRSILGPGPDADDAFQATFLALARASRALRVHDSLAPWLHLVATRTARHARRRRERLRRRERDAFALSPARDRPEPPDPDLAQIVHEELARLPDRLRVPVVLCDLEGRSLEQAARHLGCPVGTVKSRISRARDRLRDQLTRRGLAPSPAMAALTLRPDVPASLLRETVDLGRRILDGQLLPAGLARLASGASSMLPISSSRALLLPLAFLGSALGVAAWSASTQTPGENAPAPAQDTPAPDAPQTFRAGGSVESSHREKVMNGVKGESVLISVIPEGTRVQKGQVVAELDSADLRDRLVEQRADETKAQTAFQSTKDSLEAAEIGIEEYVEGLFPLEHQVAQDRITLADSELALANAKLDRIRPSGDPDAIADAEYDARRVEFERNQARQRLNVLEKYTRPRRIKELTAAVNQAKAALIAAQTEFLIQQGRTQSLERQIELCKLLAPSDGLLVHVNPPAQPGQPPAIAEGATVRERQILFEVADLSSFQINARVAEAWVHLVEPGMTVQVDVDAFPNHPLTGRVLEVHPLPDPAFYAAHKEKIYLTLISLDAPLPGLRPGMSARLLFTIPPKP